MLCLSLNKEDPEPCNECPNCKAFLEDSSQAYTERDAASQGTIEHVRKIVEDLPFAVLDAPKRIYLFDEAHRASKDAQDVLLKPIEEKVMVGMFCTTEKIRGAIRSRCEEHTIRRVTREEILAWVKRVLQAERVEHEDEAVLTVIDYTGGHLRDVLNRLEMIYQGGDITLDRVREQLNLSMVSVYYEILLKLPVDLAGALALLDKVLDKVTAEEASTGLAEAAMNSFRLANKMAADFAFLDRALADKVAAMHQGQLVKVAEYFLRSRYSNQIGLVCDVATLFNQLHAGGSPPPSVVQTPVFSPIPVVYIPQPVQVVAEVQPEVPVPPPASVVEPAQETKLEPIQEIKLSQAVLAPPLSTPQAKLTRTGTISKAEAATLDYIPLSSVDDRMLSLTEHDGEILSQRPAQGSRPTIVAPDKSGREERTPVGPDTWKRLFKGMNSMINRKAH
jgi:DNA polymerase-3 subunit gamma/tau